MYLKLAIKNVIKSYRDFLVYFMTLSFSVCLFYTFNSFQDQQAVIEINNSPDDMVTQLGGIMLFISIFVALILCFLILYANNFLMKRRKKEFGIYMLLGMPRSKISRVLVYETMFIGMISLFTGIFAGLFLSQILTALTANMFEATLHYHFVFSKISLIITIAVFFGIFFFIIMFQTSMIRKKQLIDFIKVGHERGKVKKLWLSIILFIVSLLFLGSAYYLALYDSYAAFKILDFIIVLGSIGTLLFFLSLSGFLLSMIRSSKKLYLRNLNCFVLRQLSSTVNTSFLSMSIICIMLLLSIGALATGLNLKNTINHSIKASTPYDFSIAANFYYREGENLINQDFVIDDILSQLSLPVEKIKEMSQLDLYFGTMQVKDIDFTRIKTSDLRSLDIENQKLQVKMIPVSSYNQVMRDTNQKELHLNEDQIYVYHDSEYLRSFMETLLKASNGVILNGKKMFPINTSYDISYISTTASTDTHTLYAVVPDAMIDSTTLKAQSICNINLKDTISPLDFGQEFNDLLFDNGGLKKMEAYSNLTFSWNDADMIRGNSIGLSVSFTYVGIYLGIVFLIASAAILALQLLSQAEENRMRYAILSKIGTEESMQNKAILLQIGCYFLLPLLLAIIHSIVGIQMMNSLVIFLGKGNMLHASLLTAAFFIMIYGAYFLLTYSQYKRIIKSRY